MSDQPRKCKYEDSSLLTSASPTEEDVEDAEANETDWEIVTD
jgi:hypothetical protein